MGTSISMIVIESQFEKDRKERAKDVVEHWDSFKQGRVSAIYRSQAKETMGNGSQLSTDYLILKYWPVIKLVQRILF